MAWINYDVTSYRASLGRGDNNYGKLQLFGPNFYGNIEFHKEGPLPDSTTRVSNGVQYFYGHLDFQQMPMMLDLLRNEDTIKLIWSDVLPNIFHLMVGNEPVGEGE